MTEKECDQHDEYEESKSKRIVWALLGLIVAVAFVVFLVWAILHPHGPRFVLQDVTINDFNFSQPSFLSSNLQVTLSSRNPKDKIGIFYDRLDIYASYRNQEDLINCTHCSVSVWLNMAANRNEIVWDVEDWSILMDLDLHVVVEKIRKNLDAMGYYLEYGHLTAVIDDDIPEDLLDACINSGLLVDLVPKGNKHERVHKITVDILFWALMNRNLPSNLFILSENDKQFASVVESVNKKDVYNLAFLPWSLLVDCIVSPEMSRTCDCCGLPMNNADSLAEYFRESRLPKLPTFGDWLLPAMIDVQLLTSS